MAFELLTLKMDFENFKLETGNVIIYYIFGVTLGLMVSIIADFGS